MKWLLKSKYGFGYATLALFLFSLAGHWLFGWAAFVQDQAQHGAKAEVGPYLLEAFRDTFENWQSEFLQLLWQVCGLAYLLYVGSPQSKDEADRSEAKLDAILRRVAPAEADALIEALDKKYSRLEH
jgi:hypothetical protein